MTPNDEEDPDNNYPMFNYAYPLPDEYTLNPSRARKALRHYALTIVSLAAHDRYYLALTGGGMDMSWHICGAYIAPGFYLVFRGYAAGSSWVSRASGNRSRVCWSG
jgi:hypothetical protein